MGQELDQAERVLRAARVASGMAAYAHFFRDLRGETRDVYLVALAAESEAQALLDELRRVEPSPPLA